MTVMVAVFAEVGGRGESTMVGAGGGDLNLTASRPI